MLMPFKMSNSKETYVGNIPGVDFQPSFQDICKQVCAEMFGIWQLCHMDHYHKD